ncbi:uncharacterized protein LAESUDRAFT_812562 [Laetiporus sulphureus 93-53]|uniref:Carotenoid oxygenase n=1 Tax=Laetiporus sulphureus 93-53 TaxID=1314785 RepID=A0A165EEW5_9APHY|nr:uncharacterized protein LAESUDRAFT_812562 [Laetiporus sulphureus 93-53]KZT06903.1 hypothetical protein LAESUDRAFT_812562 [Laetiporus sulphureus 93-53]
MPHRFGIFPDGQRVTYRSHKGAEDFEKRIVDAGSIDRPTRFVILCVWQAHTKQYGMSFVFNKNVAESINYNWNPKADTSFYVNGGVVGKSKTPSLFCFHHMNAFDDPVTAAESLHGEPHANGPGSSFPPSIACALLGSSPGTGRHRELYTPAAAEHRASHRGAFRVPQAVSLRIWHQQLDSKLHHTFPDGIIKLDMASSSDGTPGSGSNVWRKPAHTPSQPIFVPPRHGTIEDDGILLSVTLDENAMRISMVVLDAKEMTELARAEMKTVFPVDFHGVLTAQKL